MAHSRIGASAAERWMACPKSPAMSDGVPRRSSEYAMEGTAAHAVAEHFLGHWAKENGTDRPIVYPSLLTKVKVEEKFFDVTEEMAAAVQVYLDTIYADAEIFGKEKLLIEHKFALPDIHPELYGTNDCCLYTETQSVIVYDYKHGAGKVVEAIENPQLMIYALGALNEFPAADTVEMVIVQPRAKHPEGPIRRFTIGVEDLKAWGEKVLKPLAYETDNPEAPFNLGKWCDWCPGMGGCPAFHKHAVQTMFGDEVVPVATPLVERLSAEKLAEIVAFKPLAEKFLDACYEEVKARMMNGVGMPGLKLVEGRGVRKWVEDFDSKSGKVFQALKADMYETKIKSPAQMEKAIKAANLGMELLDGLVETSRGLLVVPVEDKREEYQIFDNFEF